MVFLYTLKRQKTLESDKLNLWKPYIWHTLWPEIRYKVRCKYLWFLSDSVLDTLRQKKKEKHIDFKLVALLFNGCNVKDTLGFTSQYLWQTFTVNHVGRQDLTTFGKKIFLNWISEVQILSNLLGFHQNVKFWIF